MLDTNVVSALMRAEREPYVVGWLDGISESSVWTTAISVFEVRLGLERMAHGSRRRELEMRFALVVEHDLGGKVLAFDLAAATAAARISATQQRVGRPQDIRDVQIAGITKARGGKLVTRNTRHFSGIGLELIDPWNL